MDTREILMLLYRTFAEAAPCDLWAHLKIGVNIGFAVSFSFFSLFLMDIFGWTSGLILGASVEQRRGK